MSEQDKEAVIAALAELRDNLADLQDELKVLAQAHDALVELAGPEGESAWAEQNTAEADALHLFLGMTPPKVTLH